MEISSQVLSISWLNQQEKIGINQTLVEGTPSCLSEGFLSAGNKIKALVELFR